MVFNSGIARESFVKEEMRSIGRSKIARSNLNMKPLLGLVLNKQRKMLNIETISVALWASQVQVGGQTGWSLLNIFCSVAWT